MVKKFTIPFASQGDANDIPDALQVDGKVSYTQGFGYDYERPYDDPQSKDINREDMNGLFKAITSAIGEMQTLGASEYDKSLKYPKGAIVYYNKDLYISQVDDNINTPPQQWTSIKNIADDSLKKAMNLSDLTNVAEARKNLGLGNSATLNKTDVLGASSDLLATQKLVSDTNTNLTNAVNKKWDKQDTIGTGNIVRKSITDSLYTRVTSAHNRADSAYNLADSKWSPQPTVGDGKLMRETATVQNSGLLKLTSNEEIFSYLKTRTEAGRILRATENSGMIAPQYSTGISGSVSDTWFALFVDYRSGVPTFMGGTTTGLANVSVGYTTKNTTTDKSGFLRASGSANALTESDRTSFLGTSTTLVASQKLVNDVNNRINDVPVDQIFYFESTTPPAGYIARNGQAIDRNTMPKLYARYGAKMPDDRDRYHRMTGSLTGAVGSTQEDAMQKITGDFKYLAHGREKFATASGAFSVQTSSEYIGNADGGNGPTEEFTFDSSRVARTAEETRVKSRIVIFCNKIQ